MFHVNRIPVGTRVLYTLHAGGKAESRFGIIDHYDCHGNAIIADSQKHLREVRTSDIASTEGRTPCSSSANV